MKVFNCDECGNLIFFENFRCVRCEHRLAYSPDRADMLTLIDDACSPEFRLCANDTEHNVCNWAVPADDPNPLCVSCRLTRVIPNLSVEGNISRWGKIEAAKRRALYTLLALKLPFAPKEDADDEGGLAFEFLADPDPDDPKAKPVLTGHAHGLITLNIAEADDAEREKRRTQMGEPYRTLLGHFRHELAHHYWDRLIADGPDLLRCRAVFGDETEDYGESLKRYYASGAPADWQDRFVSAYAASHPWEDWAESWAHYMHITDTLEMAIDCGLSLRPWRKGEPTLKPSAAALTSFDKMMANWISLSYVLNNLNRCLGQLDSYPFVLSPPAIEKLRFIHDVIGQPG